MRYIPGTIIQRRDGHLFIKTTNAGLIKQARHMVMLKEGRPLDKNERVFFRDGNRENVTYDNLTTVHFAEARFKYLPHARVIYVPKGLNHATQRPAERTGVR